MGKTSSYHWDARILVAIALVVSVTSCSKESIVEGRVPKDEAPIPTVLDIDGNSYGIVSINGQNWMTENLRTSRYLNGDLIPLVQDSIQWRGLTTGATCWFSSDPSNAVRNGRLYNWHAVADSRGLCPQGWRVASSTDWSALSGSLGGGAVSGGYLKVAGTEFWLAPNAGASNAIGFNAYPSGGRSEFSEFYIPGWSAVWWVLNGTGGGGQSAPYMWVAASEPYLIGTSAHKRSGHCVRCIQN